MAANTLDFVKIALTESVIASIHDSELVSLQAELDLLTLQNQSMIEYTKMFKNTRSTCAELEAEFEDITGYPCPGPTVEMDDLWETFETLNRMLVATRRNCDEMRELQAFKDDLQASFPARKQLFEKVKNLLLDDRYDPNAKELMTKLDASSSELQYAKTTHAAVARELAELNANIQEQDRRHQDEVNKLRLEMDRIDREFAEEHKYSESSIEDEVAAETAILDKKLKELGKLLRGDVDDDDDSSSISSALLLRDQMEMPIIEIMTTDLEDLFKNPNDFDLTTLATNKPTKKPPSKKKEIGDSQQSSPGSRSAKRIKLAHQSETKESDSGKQLSNERKLRSVSPLAPRNAATLSPIKPIPAFKSYAAAIKYIPAVKSIPATVKPIPATSLSQPVHAETKPIPAASQPIQAATEPIPASAKSIQAEAEVKEIIDDQQSSLKTGSADAAQEEIQVPMNESFDSASDIDQEMGNTKNDEMDVDSLFGDDDDQLQSGNNSFANMSNVSDDGKENPDFDCLNDGNKSAGSGFDFFGDDGKSAGTGDDFDFFGSSKTSSDDKTSSSLF